MIAKIIDKNTIEVFDLSQFDADAIMHSGQVFRYFENNGGYKLVVGNNYADIATLDGKVIIKSNDSHFFWDYFDFDTDYSSIKRELSVYETLRPAILSGGGIRILRADFFETVISFIISANNNIKRFTKTLNLMSERYGNSLTGGLYSFPTLEQLLPLSEADFKDLGCGYRSPYLVKSICQLKNMDKNKLASLSNDLLNKELMSIQGVGPKVCACIKLFCGSFHRIDTAPVDTWINKALSQLPENDKAALLTHKYAGIAQQYIFYYLQHLHREL